MRRGVYSAEYEGVSYALRAYQDSIQGCLVLVRDPGTDRTRCLSV